MKKNKIVPADPVRILCAANAAYAAPLCVMLVSLLINHAKGRKIEIYVLATNIPDEDRRKIEASLCRNRPDFELRSLHWLSPSLDVLQELYIANWAQLEVYARLLAPRVLPKDFDKVLYLDSDMVILSDVSPLYDSMCDDSAVHAVRDDIIGNVSEPRGVFNYSDLGIPSKTHYFNSGVMLMNLRRWREQNITTRVIEYLRIHQALVQHWDQGGLNAILHDSWTEMDPSWNQIHGILKPWRWKELGRSMVEWRRTKNHPKIVHYTSREKPWLSDSLPRYSYFFKYLDKTSYRTAFKGRRLERIIGFKLNFFLWRMNNSYLALRDRMKDKLRPLLKPLLSRMKSSLKKQ